jgi:DNA polymerase V
MKKKSKGRKTREYDSIIVKGAREHNLKNIHVELPKKKLIVFTGVSGSGKSSLAFDTIFAEGQRRYVESLSAYARQFIGQMEKPRYDTIRGLSPTISIEQKAASNNPRSTVGTITEIYDYLRVLFARAGTQHCHKCGKKVGRGDAGSMVDQILSFTESTRILILAPIIENRKGEHRELFDGLKADGFARVRIDGVVHDLSDVQSLARHKKHNIEVFSSNYALYGDISSRVMATLEELAPQLEVYSIDEAFLDLSGFGQLGSLEDYGQKIRQTIAQNIGISVCVGLAPTKTLAKLANYASKKYQATQGVVDLTHPDRQRKLMEITPVGEIWGVGRKHAEALNRIGIKTAQQLAAMDTAKAHKQYSIAMVKTIDELNGQVRYASDDSPPARQQIMCSRSFGERMTEYSSLRDAVCEFAARTAERLRESGRVCSAVNVTLRTSMFNQNEPRYSNAATGKLPNPGSDTREILRVATGLFHSIWRDGYSYAKAGVMLADICDPNTLEQSLFADPVAERNDDRLMLAIDKLNQRGQGQVWFGGQRPKKDWFMKRAHLSPAYTTRWSDLPEVN